MKTLGREWSQGMLATTRRRIFCVPVCYPKEGVCSMELDTMEILCVLKNKAIARVGTAARFADLCAVQLARSQFTTERACDRPFRSRFFHVFARSCDQYWVATQAVLCTACLSCSPPHINFRISARNNLPKVIKTYLLSFNCKIQPRCSNCITYCKLQQSIASFRREVVGNCVLQGY